MNPLSSAISTGFTWTKLPRFRGYELHWDHDVVGMLHTPRFGCSKFLAKTSEREWIFRRSGFLGSSSEILEAETQRLLATFKAGWGMQGMLTFSDGQSFHLACKGVWHPLWNITNERGQTVLSVHMRERQIEVPESGVGKERLVLLTMFALYRAVQAEQDAASAAMVAVIS